MAFLNKIIIFVKHNDATPFYYLKAVLCDNWKLICFSENEIHFCGAENAVLQKIR